MLRFKYKSFLLDINAKTKIGTITFMSGNDVQGFALISAYYQQIILS